MCSGTQTELDSSQWECIQSKRLHSCVHPIAEQENSKNFGASVWIAALVVCLTERVRVQPVENSSRAHQNADKSTIPFKDMRRRFTPGDSIGDVELPLVSPAAIQIK